MIANTNYAGADPLTQLTKDAAALANELRRIGFDTEVKQNQSKLALQSTLDAFKAKIKPGSTVLIYLGGYGIQAGRQNYFIPIGAQIWTEADVARDGVSIESILAALNASGARVKLAVLDLSRRNPFERRFRSYSAGLGSVGIPLNTLIISAAGQNQVIHETPSDGTLFMRELLKEMRVPGVTADVVFNKTRLGVSLATNNEEVPWVSSSLTAEFYFHPQPGKPAPIAHDERKDEAQKKAARKEQAKQEEDEPEEAKKKEPKKDAPKPDEKQASIEPRPGGCADQVALTESHGIADLQIINPCRKGTVLSVTAGPFALQANFDAQGKARLRIPLFQETTDIVWTGGDGKTNKESVRFTGFRDAFRVGLLWRQPIDLQLHVVEPGGSVNSPKGHVWRNRPNADFQAGVGSLRIDAAGASGAERVEVYDIPPQRNPRNGLFKVYVDFVARGDTAAPPYCGTGELAAPSFEILVLRYGRLESARKFGFRAERCDAPASGRR
ncbi:MAG: caspase family protein, partial [Rhodoplanes sp.]